MRKLLETVTTWGNMGELCIIGDKVNGFKDAVDSSLSPCVLLLCDLFSRVGWKDQKLENFFASSSSTIEEFWYCLTLIPH